MNDDRFPLSGLKVVELARVLAGPWVGQTLADLGADVIKVESPDGDGTRQWGPPWIDRGAEAPEAAYYHACNRGKRSVVADFNDPADLDSVRHLCSRADVVVENFKTGTLAKFGLDYRSLQPANPRLVYCSITGFGQTGPRAHEAGYDFVVQGMSGFMSLTGEPDGNPMKMGISISDLTCGLYSTIAIQSALMMRERTGTGQHIDMSLLDCSIALLASQALSQFATGANPPRMGNAHAQVVPYGVFATADGHVILAPANDRLFVKMMHVLKRDDLAGDIRLADNPGRIENRGWMDKEIADEVRTWNSAELMAACKLAGVPAGPINRIDEVFDEPQVAARGMKIETDGVPGVRSPFVFSGADLAFGRASPKLGEENVSIWSSWDS
ncbi:CaiB/BaiF CoA transferase family protein [Pontixanthobacter gangjinensis]|uniref:CoA transferase n=1 Tax=Pontixanthobacter gangjinensis TaxID=1028742 RepID=A0A6I4SKY1_9SPHN|nr:CaiB/BaiF CoA-transferase family protein [Pontixanthobacter gangjinensis]MXO55452.1 CoA transferase [Pontixanthobacter gangjinensis]